MITLAQLTGANRRTYQKILTHPVPDDLRRTAVRPLLETLGRVTETEEHLLNVTRNGHVLMLRQSGSKQVESKATVVSLRHFLKRSEVPLVRSNGREAHLLLVIGLHEIRLFRADAQGGSIKQLLPDDGVAHYTIAAPDGVAPARAGRGPNYGGIFEPVATALRATGDILIFGESSLTQAKMDHFIDWVKQGHPDLAKRIVGSVVLTGDRLEAGLLLAKARQFHVHPVKRTTRVTTDSTPPSYAP